MANTTNLDLVKPLGTDHALISVINGNMDKVDAYAGKVNESLAGVQDGLAIVAVGDTHAAITSGQFVYVKEHNTLPEGLYTASADIAANGALSTSNLTADSKGGLNTISDSLTCIQDGLAIVAVGDTHGAITSGQFVYVKNHSTLQEGLYTASANIAANATLSGSNLTADSNGGLNALSDHIANIDGWNYINFARGSNPVTYPATAKELLVITSWENSSFDYGYSIIIPVTDCAVSHFRTGAYATSTNNGSVGVNIDRTNRKVNISSLYYNGTEYNNGYIAVYYK